MNKGFIKIVREQQSAIMAMKKKDAALVCVAICERLFPSYIFFEHQRKWGDSATLRRALDESWTKIISNDVKTEALQQFYNNILNDKVIPDSNDFGETSDTLGQEAALAVANLLDFLINGKKDNLKWLIEYPFESLNRHIVDSLHLYPDGGTFMVKKEDEEKEEKIVINDVLFKNELNRQNRDMARAANLTTPDSILLFKKEVQKEKIF